MDPLETSDDSREFHCVHCREKIVIPIDLPPTEGPCPHCGKIIISPALQATPPLAKPQSTGSSSLPVRKSPITKNRTSKALKLTPIPKSEQADNEKPVVLSNPLPKEGKSNQQATLKKISPPESSESAPTKNEPQLKKISPPAEKPEDAEPPKSKSSKPTIRKPSSSKPIASRHVPGSDILTGTSKDDLDKILQEELGRSPKNYLSIIAFIILLAITASAILYYSNRYKNGPVTFIPKQTPIDRHEMTDDFIRDGWIQEARATLNGYINASTCEGKIPYIIGGHSMLNRLKSFYQTSLINDLDTPIEQFKPSPLSISDHQRGLFRMIYKDHESATGEPVIVHAFFKHTDVGLKLDWEIFAQTKYRSFHDFTSTPHVGKSETFRVFISQQPQLAESNSNRRTYLISDPAYTKEIAPATSEVGSQAEQTMTPVLGEIINQKPVIRTATVELKWVKTKSSPELVISKFICWEFLGLGSDANAPDNP